MGVIRWEEINRTDLFGGKRKSWSGIIGEHDGFICQIFPTEKNGVEYAKVEFNDRFPGYDDVPGAAADALFFVGVDNAKMFAEQILDAWVDKAGLVPKTSAKDALVLGDAEIGLLDELLGSRIAEDSGTYKALKALNCSTSTLYEYYIAQARDLRIRLQNMMLAKQCTEADFRDADIDGNGYVTFSDGGAA